MIEMERSVATSATKKQVIPIVDKIRTNCGNGIFSTVLLSQLLFLFGREAFSQWLRHVSLLIAYGTVTLMRELWVF
jgi:hypothetical protein